MTEVAETINATGDSSTPQAGSDELIGTMDIPQETPAADSSEGTQNTQVQDEPQVKDGEKDVKDPDPEPQESVRFDQHPRFQELIKEKNTLKSENREMAQRLEAIEAKVSEPPKPDADEKGLFGMGDEDLLEQFSDDPKAFLQKFAQHIEESVTSKFSEATREQSYQDAVNTQYEQFAKDNEGFMDLWNSGEIQEFLNQNPAHNAMSAYYALTANDRKTDQEGAIKEAVEKAVKETEERITKNFKAKRNAQVLPAGPSAGGKSADTAPELKDPKKFGGITAVLTQRLRERRAAQ